MIKNALSTHTIVQKWGDESCLSLPAFHALTDCDTTSSFHRIGKRSAFKCLLKHLKDVPHLRHLGCQPVSDNYYRDVENFVASLYSQKFESDKSLSRVRYMQVMTTDKSTASLPPTSDALRQHVKRAHLQSAIWCNSHRASF